MSTFGIDFAERTPSTDLLKRHNVKFVMRYLSDYESKNLSHEEAQDLTHAGINMGVVWEDGATDATGSSQLGINNARTASSQAHICGMPGDRPIFLAVDNDYEGPEVGAYFEGVKSVLGMARTGVYGGYKVCKWLHDHGLVGWSWQTYAWSYINGAWRWDPRSHLRQYSNSHNLEGLDCDYDSAVFADYGQWRIGWTPAKPNLYPVLAHGSRGAAVMRLSRNLHFLRDPESGHRPYYRPDLKVFPGVAFFTAGLEDSLKTFQYRRNLARSGKTYRATWTAIANAIRAQKAGK